MYYYYFTVICYNTTAFICAVEKLLFFFFLKVGNDTLLTLDDLLEYEPQLREPVTSLFLSEYQVRRERWWGDRTEREAGMDGRKVEMEWSQ